MDECLKITVFTDPMMGLSYESEPVFRKLESHFGDLIVVRHSMGLLVRDVRDWIDRDEFAADERKAVEDYNMRLADIYRNEESLGGLPINMDGFRLFSRERRSSYPLNLAFKAAELAAPAAAGRFLYNMRFATIAETRPTTMWNEIVRVARMTGIDEEAFTACYEDGSAEAALDRDLAKLRALGFNRLPSYVLEYGAKRAHIQQLIGYEGLVYAIAHITGGLVHPHPVSGDVDALKQLLAAHPLISLVEIRDALDLRNLDDADALAKTLVSTKEASFLDARRGLFLLKTNTPEWRILHEESV